MVCKTKKLSDELKRLRSDRCLGDWDGRREVTIDFPLAFQNAFVAMRSRAIDSTKPFTYVHLSGKLTEQNQLTSLWYLEDVRKLKVGIRML